MALFAGGGRGAGTLATIGPGVGGLPVDASEAVALVVVAAVPVAGACALDVLGACLALSDSLLVPHLLVVLVLDEGGGGGGGTTGLAGRQAGRLAARLSTRSGRGLARRKARGLRTWLR